ncbi:MAG TPA: histidine--tRNA ligase, partial [Candidatus Latescibacteria bacterium]|nr:histidine--tRNA ligase [Candidatus Latescibacterota bacterium]
VGLAVGDMAMTELLKELDKLPNGAATGATVLVSIFSEEHMAKSSELADQLRDEGIRTELYLNPKHKLDRQFRHADRKQIRYVAILGPDEAANGTVALKDLTTGKQQTVKPAELPRTLGA